MFNKVFKSLGSKILALSILIIVIAVVISVVVSQKIMRSEILVGLESEMHGYLEQASSLTDSIGEFWETDSFDRDAMLAELENLGDRDYRETRLYQAIPVVAAWKAVETAARDADFTFRVVRENPRNPVNAPENELERRVLNELNTERDLKDVFVVDKDAGVIAYAAPVVMSESCMACHGDPANSPTGDGRDVLGFEMEDWRVGDRRGVYLLTAPIAKVDEQVAGIVRASALWAPVLILLISAVVFIAVRKFNRLIGRIVSQLSRGADEVNNAAHEVTNASQTLAEGASEQAASLEETSSSMEEIRSKVLHNAEVAKETTDVSEKANESSKEGSLAMEQLRGGVSEADRSAREMNQAMMEIKESSDSISKIIKTIDEIAFQTNILALNAAVEAARAGEAGAGFAVVADEVRSLAGRAAEAAGETTRIIEDSISRTENGVRANEAVVEHLKNVMERAGNVESGLQEINRGVSGVNDSMAELVTSAAEQSAGIDEINTALSQVNDVTQTNAASAEETASASEEMNAQAVELKNVIADLQMLVHGRIEEEGKQPALGDNNQKGDMRLPQD